ncbi:MAG: GH3 auxin-responsive promoter family protein [Myxococcota bacterium]
MKSFAAARALNPVLGLLARRRLNQWLGNLTQGRLQKTQESILLSHCKTAAETEFGQAHGFAKVKTYADFKRATPLRPYAGFEPYIQRMRQGERDILWPGLISYYGQSSGTSATAAQNKFLPISKEQIVWQQKAAFDVIAQYLRLSKDRGFVGGYNLGLFPPSVLKSEGNGVFTGSNPGIMFRELPALARPMAIPKPSVRDILDYNQKLQAIAENYWDYDVHAISGTSCWFSIFFDKLLAHRGVRTIQEIWPNLRVLFGGGVNANPYRRLINERVGRDIILMDNYNATEGGLFSVTDHLEDRALLMIPDRGVFFEFVPREKHGRDDAPRLALWEVQPGVDYSIVLTTSSGLFAYYIGDFVRFNSVYPHRMEFVGRPSGVLSLTQELTTYVEIEKAVAKAQSQFSCSIVEYCVGPEVGVDASGKGRYQFFFEFEKRPMDLNLFMTAIDDELKIQNRVYREHRLSDVAILPPVSHKLLSGSVQKIMDRLGFRSVQSKFPRIIDQQKCDLVTQFINKEQVS